MIINYIILAQFLLIYRIKNPKTPIKTLIIPLILFTLIHNEILKSPYNHISQDHHHTITKRTTTLFICEINAKHKVDKIKEKPKRERNPHYPLMLRSPIKELVHPLPWFQKLSSNSGENLLDLASLPFLSSLLYSNSTIDSNNKIPLFFLFYK